MGDRPKLGIRALIITLPTVVIERCVTRNDLEQRKVLPASQLRAQPTICRGVRYTYPTYEYRTLGFHVASVPEPGSLALLLSCAVAFGIWVRVKRITLFPFFAFSAFLCGESS